MRGTTLNRIASILGVAAVILVASVVAFELSSRITPQGSPARPQLSLSVATDRSFYSFGENVNITVQLRNVGTVAAELGFGSCFQATYLVEDRVGSAV